MKKIIGALTCLLVLSIAGNGWAKILYVKTNGLDTNTGLSWQEAVQTIQVAVGLADSGDQIWVAGGTYALSSRIVVDKAVSIYGGFAGGETDLNQRNWQNNVTTVDGQDTVNCFTVTADATIDGLSIKRGVGVDGIGYWDAGGGIHHSSSSLIVANCNLTENQSAEFGAAIYSELNSSLLVTDCIFTDNFAYTAGGAIFCYHADLIVSDCTFSYNDNMDGSGGAIYAAAESNISITDCAFHSNWAEDGGGAISASKGTISNCTFSNNIGIYGGGAISLEGSLLITNCKFTGNYASRAFGGGAIFVSGNSNQSKITNCQFSKNKYGAMDYGMSDGGGAIHIWGDSAPIITNCTFHGNIADDYYGQFPSLAGAIFSEENAAPTIINSIFWGNISPDGSQIKGGTPIISYSDIDQDGYEGINANIRQDPLFVDPDNGDFHLSENSPCKDAGDNNAPELPDTDIDGDPRIINGVVDMGADEYDYCPNDPNKTEPGICGCGTPDTDSDGDGIPDCNDGCLTDPNKNEPGVCGCGVPDTDSDVDGVADCNDGCPTDPNKTGPGICGCGIADTDSDGDGTFDCVDTDDDNDGLADEEEQGPSGDDPNYDGNDDGIADSLQDNVASFHTYDNQSYVTMETPVGTSISNCKALDNPSPTNSPLNIEFSYGLFEFTITGIGNGSVTTVILHFPVGASFDTYYKYGPTPSNTIDHWYEFLNDGQAGAEINGNVITLHFVDGKRGDDDLTADGIVIDMGGPAVSLNPSGGDGTSTSGGGGGGGGGGCFIGTAVNSLEW